MRLFLTGVMKFALKKIGYLYIYQRLGYYVFVNVIYSLFNFLAEVL